MHQVIVNDLIDYQRLLFRILSRIYLSILDSDIKNSSQESYLFGNPHPRFGLARNRSFGYMEYQAAAGNMCDR